MHFMHALDILTSNWLKNIHFYQPFLLYINAEKIIKKVKLYWRKLDEWENSPLHLASFHGLLGIVQLLFKTDPEVVYYRNIDGRSPNHSAAEGGHIEVYKELV